MNVEQRVAAMTAKRQTVTLITQGQGVYTDDGENVRTETTYTVKAGVRGFRPDEIVGRIQQGDREIRIAATDIPGVIPKEQDAVIVNGVTLNIYAVNDLRWSENPTLFVLYARG